MSSLAEASCGAVITDSDAPRIELFNGVDFTGWTQEGGTAPRWRIQDGYLEVVPGSGSLQTTGVFMDFDLHAEFWVPSMPQATGQNKGNSGIYLLGRYEIQILDSLNNPTYFAGQCASLYQLIAPTRNACLPAEHWQTYDISFYAPRVDGGGKVSEAGRLTVIHNGTKVIDNGRFYKPTGAASKKPQGVPGPIQLQDHGAPVRFRNLWMVPK